MIRSCSFLLLALLTSTHALAEKEYALSESETAVRCESQDLQLTPQAVTVIDGEEVETTYHRDLEDLQGLAPGLIVDSLSGTPQGAAISLRGVGTDDVNNGFFIPA